MATIKLRWTAAAQPDSVVLADPTDTYGVRRKDTQAVLVVPGTPMLVSGGGLYEYTFEDPGQGLGYDYWARFYVAGSIAIALHRSIRGTQVFVPAIESVESPALVVATLLRELNMASDRSNYNPLDKANRPDWIVDVGELQDDPHETLTIYDSGAAQDGIIQTPDGPLALEHGDIQIRGRSQDYMRVRRKLVEIKDTIIKIRNRQISVESAQGLDPVLHNIAGLSVLSGVAYIGPDSKARKSFTVNFRTTIQRVKV